MELFATSLYAYMDHFSLSAAILLIMAFFMLLGGFDKLRGNRWGYGESFDAGYAAMGTLASAMIGMIALVPVLKELLSEPLSAFFGLFGCDPSIFSGLILGMDLGGYPLSQELTSDPVLGSFTGVIVASVMGINFVFTIPVGMSIISEADRPYLASGMLLGFATVPLACLAGGIVMMASGFSVSLQAILLNTLPVALFSLLIIIGLLVRQQMLLRGFILFGTGITQLVTAATMIAVFQYLTGIRLPLFHVMVEPDSNGIVPLLSAIQTVGGIALVLLGAFPLIAWISRNAQKPLQKIGSKIGLNEASVTGLIANLANNIPMFQLMKDMNDKGKIVNCAFTVAAAFLLGDHLGFCANADATMIVPMLAAKFTGGITALALALLLWQRVVPQKTEP